MKRFYYSVPGTNVFGCLRALSKTDALHQFINGPYAPLYGRAQWMVGEEPPSCEQQACGPIAVTVHD